MKTIVTVLFILTSFFALAQQAMSIDEAREKEIYPAINDEYKSTRNTDVNEAVNKKYGVFTSFLSGFTTFLSHNDFYWAENTRCSTCIYVAPDGTIKYFLYDFKNLSPEKEERFKMFLNDYIKEYKLGTTADEKFSHCRLVVYAKSIQ